MCSELGSNIVPKCIPSSLQHGAPGGGGKTVVLNEFGALSGPIRGPQTLQHMLKSKLESRVVFNPQVCRSGGLLGRFRQRDLTQAVDKWINGPPHGLQGLSVLAPPGAPWASSWAALGGSWLSRAAPGPLLAPFGLPVGPLGAHLSTLGPILAENRHF